MNSVHPKSQLNGSIRSNPSSSYKYPESSTVNNKNSYDN